MATHKIEPINYTREQAIMITLGVNPKTYWIDAPVQSIVSAPSVVNMNYQPQPQMTYQPQPQMTYQPRPQMNYQPQPQMNYQPQPQAGLPSIHTSLPPIGQFGMPLPYASNSSNVMSSNNTDGYFSGNDDEDDEDQQEDESQD